MTLPDLRPAACLRLLLTVLTLLSTLCAGMASAQTATISGNASMSVSGTQVALSIDKISNTSSSGTTGSLRIELWATRSAYSGGSISGYKTASIRTSDITGGSDTLGPNQYFSSLKLNLPYTAPPSDYTYFTIIVSEYDSVNCTSSDKFCINSHLSLGSTSNNVTFSGVIRDQFKNPIPGATVTLTASGKSYSSMTDNSGKYAITFNKSGLPTSMAYLITKEGYAPVAAPLNLGSNGNLAMPDLEMEPLGPGLVQFDVIPSLHHLGNGRFSGSVNSQFQMDVEGTVYAKEFTLSAQQAAASEASITMMVKGIDQNCKDTLDINGTRIGYLPASPSSGAFGTTRMAIPVSALKVGVNKLTITATYCTSDIDDFEFTNGILRLSGLGTATTVAAPTIGSVSAGDGQATITINPPAQSADGTTYTVKSNPAGGVDLQAGSAGLTHVVSNLTNGVSYTFTVTAHRNGVSSQPSGASVAVTPASGSYTLSVSRTGSGTVQSGTSGINCGAVCSASYARGTTVQLSANAAAGYRFDGWGGACSGSGACSVAMNSSQSVSARFVAVDAGAVPGAPVITSVTAGDRQVTVTLAAPSNTGGSAITGYTVTSVPAGGVDNQAGSAALVHVITGLTNGQAYQFRAVATNAAGTGAASTASVSVTPAAATAGGAMLAISLSGEGVVSSAPAGIACGARCSASFPAGATVTLSAAPAAGFTFAGWGGECSGSAACTVTLDKAKHVSATFVGSADSGKAWVTDPKTGLQWARCAIGQIWSGSTCQGTPTQLAWQAAGSQAATSSPDGKSGWRLPNVRELLTLVDAGQGGAAIDSARFPNTAAGAYWSDTPAAMTFGSAWQVDFASGASLVKPRTGTAAVRLVRDSSANDPRYQLSHPFSQYVVRVNGEVIDTVTGLIWSRCPVGQTFSGGACTGNATMLSQEAAVALAKQGTWRLPTAAELETLVDYVKAYPLAINSTVFPSAAADVWSLPVRSAQAYGVALNQGTMGPDSGSALKAVYLVRTGELSSASQGSGNVVKLSKARSAYALVRNGQGFVISDKSGSDGALRLANTQRLQFTDGAVALDVDGEGLAGKAYRLYQAAFNRTPDVGGLGYWIAMLDSGLTLDQAAQHFLASDEFKSLYGNAASPTDYINALYSNVLHRTPDQAGYDYWLSVLRTEADKGPILRSFSESGENRSQVANAVGGGIVYTPYGTSQGGSPGLDAGVAAAGADTASVQAAAHDSQPSAAGVAGGVVRASAVGGPAQPPLEAAGHFASEEHPGLTLYVPPVADAAWLLTLPDDAGNWRWFELRGCTVLAGQCSGALFRSELRGAQVKAVRVGAASVQWSAGRIAMTYALDGATAPGALQAVLSRQVVASGRFAPDVDASGVWRGNAAQAAAGGMERVAMTQQFDTLLATWYGYADDGSPRALQLAPCVLRDEGCQAAVLDWSRQDAQLAPAGGARLTLSPHSVALELDGAVTRRVTLAPAVR